MKKPAKKKLLIVDSKNPDNSRYIHKKDVAGFFLTRNPKNHQIYIVEGKKMQRVDLPLFVLSVNDVLKIADLVDAVWNFERRLAFLWPPCDICRKLPHRECADDPRQEVCCYCETKRTKPLTGRSISLNYEARDLEWAM